PLWWRRRFADLAWGVTWLGAAHAALVSEQTEDLARRACCTGREQATPTLSRELLADELVDVPPATAGSGWLEPDCRELLVRGKGRRPRAQSAMSTARAASVREAEWPARQGADTTRPIPSRRCRQGTGHPQRCRAASGCPEVGRAQAAAAILGECA